MERIKRSERLVSELENKISSEMELRFSFILLLVLKYAWIGGVGDLG